MINTGGNQVFCEACAGVRVFQDHFQDTVVGLSNLNGVADVYPN